MLFTNFASILFSYSRSDFFGKLIFLSLFILSILSWVILTNKIIATLKIKKASNHLISLFKEKINDLLSISIDINNEKHPYMNIYKELLTYTKQILKKNKLFLTNHHLSKSDIQMLSYRLGNEINLQMQKLEKNIFLLPTIVTIAPFLGLLGTVWGISITFSGMNNIDNSNAFILTGLSTALYTTILGLIVAIPALISYNYLKNLLKQLETDMESFSNFLIVNLEIQYKMDKK